MDEEITEEQRLKLVGTYKHGSIRRVKLTNFLTYSNVDFKPGPRLNMVVGPNGTGKSTILCAICLGLGGEPRLLGRASEIGTFVMNGEDAGEILIEIENTEGGVNPVIRRVIERDSSRKANFWWNDAPVSAKFVRETALNKFQITVDNLCTFLPQDRVGSFSGFDSKALLVETEKSLSSSQHLFHLHQELIEAQKELKGGNNHVETLEEKLQQLQVENQRLEREKERMEERQLALEQAELLEKKLLWLKFDAARESAIEKKAKRKELKGELKQAEAQYQPLVDEHHQAELQEEKTSERFKKFDSQIQKHKKEMEKQAEKYENHDDNIEQTLSDLATLDSNRALKQRKFEETKRKLDELTEHLKTLPTSEALEEQEREARQQHKALMPQYDAAKRGLRQLELDIEGINEDHRREKAKWTKLQDEKARRRERIFRQQPQLQRICNWLQENRNKFRKEVVGPIMCEVATKSKNTAAYLEQHVPNSTLKSFVVQDKQDYDFLYNSIRKGLKLPINLILVEHVPPAGPRMYSDQKMQELKTLHGVSGFMDESFTAPPLVLQALKVNASIDKVLIGSEKTQRSLDSENLRAFLSESETNDGKLKSYCIFASDGERAYKYTSSISKYSQKENMRVDEVRPAKWLAPGVSEEAKKRVQEELEKCQKRLAELEPQVDKAREDLAKSQADAQEANQRVKEARLLITNLTKMRGRVRNAERKHEDAKAALETDDEEEKKQKLGVLKKRIKHSLLALEAHAQSYKQMMAATVQSSGARLDKELAVARERQLRHQKAEAERTINETKQRYQDAVAAFNEAKRELIQLQKDAEESAPLHDENGEELPLKAQLEDLAMETPEETQAALEEAQHTANSIVADRNVVRQYEARQREMEEVQAELDSVNGSKEKRKTELLMKFKPWEQSLEESVAKVDALFSRYMRELGCTGEIKLTKGEPADEEEYGNFKDWGIEIRVSFREGIKPAVLSAQRQSGGERSVSTIMYLMALQDMMVSPFRCVDEINQGLDDRNERLVFRRIVENSCRPTGRRGLTDHSGQYFLITPKLLPNLTDMENEAMTVLCIFNGPYNFKSPGDWNVQNLIELRKRRFESDGHEDDENTPNSQPDKMATFSSKKRRLSSENV